MAHYKFSYRYQRQYHRQVKATQRIGRVIKEKLAYSILQAANRHFQDCVGWIIQVFLENGREGLPRGIRGAAFS